VERGGDAGGGGGGSAVAAAAVAAAASADAAATAVVAAPINALVAPVLSPAPPAPAPPPPPKEIAVDTCERATRCNYCVWVERERKRERKRERERERERKRERGTRRWVRFRSKKPMDDAKKNRISPFRHPYRTVRKASARI
jgi:hypothetical protein